MYCPSESEQYPNMSWARMRTPSPERQYRPMSCANGLESVRYGEAYLPAFFHRGLTPPQAQELAHPVLLCSVWVRPHAATIGLCGSSTEMSTDNMEAVKSSVPDNQIAADGKVYEPSEASQATQDCTGHENRQHPDDGLASDLDEEWLSEPCSLSEPCQDAGQAPDCLFTEVGCLGEVASSPSFGSVGHPLQCAPACKYVTKARGCKDGDQCSHCHICTWHSRGRPSKTRHYKMHARRRQSTNCTTLPMETGP